MDDIRSGFFLPCVHEELRVPLDFVGCPFCYYWCDHIIQKIWVQKSPHCNLNCGSPAAIASIDLGQSWCSNLQTAHIADSINFNMFAETCHTFEMLHCLATTSFDSIWLYGLHGVINVYATGRQIPWCHVSRINQGHGESALFQPAGGSSVSCTEI